MKNIIIFLMLVIPAVNLHADDQVKTQALTCQDFSWSDVETLVAPYLDDSLHTALVMQGQSANYKTSAAASMALSKSMPEVIQKILRFLIKADC